MSRSVAGLISLAIILAVVFGWVMNLIAAFSAHSIELVIRLVGIFVFPIGVLAGWLI